MSPAAPSRLPERVAPPDADRILAAEYVLGTLDNDDRRRVRARCAADPQFAGLVRLWERRLAPLHELAVPVIPSPEIWRAIASDLRSAPPALRGATLPRGLSPSPDPPRRPALPEGRPLRSAAGTGEGAVSRVRRLFGLGKSEQQGRVEPSRGAERASRRRSFPPLDPVPAAPPGRITEPDRAPEGPHRDLRSATLTPQAGGLAPPRPTLAPPTRLAEATAPLQLAPPPPPRPRPTPEPLAPPPAFIFLEPDPPPEPIAETPSAGSEPLVEAASVQPEAGDGQPPSGPDAAAPEASAEPSVPVAQAGGVEAAEVLAPPDAPQGEPVGTAEAVPAAELSLPAEIEAEAAPTAIDVGKVAGSTGDEEGESQPEAAGSPSAEAIDAPAPAAASAEAPTEAPSSEAPSADPAAGNKGEEAPLPGWATEVASGEVSALPDEPNAPTRVVVRHGPWRGIALLLALLCLGLGGIAAYREWVWPGEGYWVAVMQPEPLPAVSVRIDPDSGAVHVRSFAPAPPEGEIFRLWLVSPTSGARLIGTFSSGLSERLPELARLGRKGLAGTQVVVTREPAAAPDPSKGPGDAVVYRGRLVPE